MAGSSEHTQQKLNTGRKIINRKLSNYRENWSSPYANLPRTAGVRKRDCHNELENSKISNPNQYYWNSINRNKSLEDLEDLLILKRNFLRPNDSQLNVTLSISILRAF